ncbi:MAG TPA: hypothetical protein VML58_00455 [Burkholderiaceae bacterium]|nr:hypothetical protein [Burkholderiaceae bacterium]
MIRPSDLPQATAWLQPPLAPQPRAGVDAASWQAEVGESNVAISCDLKPSARGLSVEQHAQRVLIHLTAERDAG